MKTIKVPHGTARAERREDMVKFKKLQRERLDILADSTFYCSESTGRAAPKEQNPHLHDVAVVVDEGGGYSSVATYESTTTFPANVCCFSGRKRLYRYGRMLHGRALTTAARINQQ